MILGITGHRKFGYYNNITAEKFVAEELEKAFKLLKPERIISGFALGTDQMAAEIAIRLGIPLVAAVPFLGQEAGWGAPQRTHYFNLLGKADEIVTVSTGGYAGWKMQKRNQFIVDKSDEMLAVLLPNTFSGGTYNCVQYAKGHEKKIHYICPNV